MKIGFNYKALKKFVVDNLNAMVNGLGTDITGLNNRVSTLENSVSEWVEITSSNGQEAEITQNFSEIRLLAKCSHNSYTLTCNYDSTIFHNTAGNADTYLICGNPIENNYGCKFRYTKLSGKQYVCAENCFEGGGNTACTFRAWIKPDNSIQ